MIMVQTPLRVSFFGGGTDFHTFFLAEGGCVLSTTIDKYIFVTIKQRFDDKLRVGYTKTEMVDHLDEIQHDLIREVLRQTKISKGVEITTMGDIPSEGSGLGSSSTVTVGALHAAYAHLGELVGAEKLAKEACQIEIERLGNPIGIQDQYIAAYGGLRFLEFTTSGNVISHQIALPMDQIRLINQNFLLFFTGLTRRASTILTEQKENIGKRLPILRTMKQLTYAAKEALLAADLDEFGRLLHESWLLKQQLASRIGTPEIGEMYAAARRAGAIGGKVAGAGGGGFLLLYCPEGTQARVRRALSHLQELPFRLEPDGSKVIFNYRRS